MLFKKGNEISTFKVDNSWVEIDDELINTEIGTHLKSYTETQEFKNKLNLYKAQQEIQELNQKLLDTDYIANKLAEAVSKYIATGDNTEVIELRTKYSKELEDRQLWRNRINELQNKYGL